MCHGLAYFHHQDVNVPIHSINSFIFAARPFPDPEEEDDSYFRELALLMVSKPLMDVPLYKVIYKLRQ